MIKETESDNNSKHILLLQPLNHFYLQFYYLINTGINNNCVIYLYESRFSNNIFIMQFSLFK